MGVQNVPYSLYVAAPDFEQRCASETDTDAKLNLRGGGSMND